MFEFPTDPSATEISGLPLVVLIPGLNNAGRVVSELLENVQISEQIPLAENWHPDYFHDYRAKRPIVHLLSGEIADVDIPHFQLGIAHDSLGKSFLVLTGQEPDYQWVTVAQMLARLVSELAVSHVTLVHSAAMPVPHTRTVQYSGVTNRQELNVPELWNVEAKFPASFVHLATQRLIASDVPCVLWTVMVPNYLAANHHPEATLKILSLISESTGLVFDTGELLAHQQAYNAQLELQLRDSEEASEMILQMEKRFDAFIQQQRLANELADLPTADEIAAELQAYLMGSNADFGLSVNSDRDPASRPAPRDGADGSGGTSGSE